MINETIKISAKDVNLYYGDNHALKNINMDIKKKLFLLFTQQSLEIDQNYLLSAQCYVLRID